MVKKTNKTSVMGWKSTALFAAAFPVLLIAGCADQDPPHGSNNLFDGSRESGDLKTILHTQDAAGAAKDATLSACHFDGAGLNSLGTQKLDLILDNDGPMPLTIYMNVPDDDTIESRRIAVGQYLQERGLTVEQIKFAMGPNPAASSPSDQGITDLKALDAATGVSASGASGGSASASGGTSN